MSRIANQPINLPTGVEVKINGQEIAVKGPKGSMDFNSHSLVSTNVAENVLTFSANDRTTAAKALAGTTRAIVNNMVVGVSAGFEKKLQLVGVGYRAQAKGSNLSLTLGFSHPVEFPAPDGITIETPSQTEIVVKGIDKQKVGQTAANIRAYRPPEPYKGKGIRYADEYVRRKEAKKK